MCCFVDVEQFEDLNATRELTVCRAEKRAFSFDHRASPGSSWQIVAQTEMKYACREVTLCSTTQVGRVVGVNVTHLMARCLNQSSARGCKIGTAFFVWVYRCVLS